MSSLDRPSLQVPAASREAFVEQEFHAGRQLAPDDAVSSTRTPAAAMEVIEFWQQAGPAMWFAKDADFDRRFRETFLSAHEAAARGDLDYWLATPNGALALVLLLDQLPRNAFRGTPRMYASDAAARRIAAEPSPPTMTGGCPPSSGNSSTFPSRIPKISPTRTGPSNCAGLSDIRTRRIPNAIATSSCVSAAFRIAIGFLAGS